ncbi:NUDIX domain-containing protein [Maribacter algicola]|uniref:NUDIX domain-containing protein n=1 Tax=Meishania litoralis TaxID=3434685 RepID=A0ACC7LKG9_9FLAO
MDELVDILDSEGKYTGKTALKSEAHRQGLFHPTVHIWFYTKNGQLLIQQRAKTKDTHPLLWDVSVAGHVGAGEDIELSAIREIQEEIGLAVSINGLDFIGTVKEVHKIAEDFTDCEFHHIFLSELKVPLKSLKRQVNEVQALRLIPLTQFSEETWGMAKLHEYVPHDVEYYKRIIGEIQSRL